MSDSLHETILAANAQQTDAPPAPPATPEQLPENFGRYRVQKLLGRGGMGSVWLAMDTQLQRPVALKVPAFTRDCPKEMLQRFYREAQSAATLSHPGICPVYDVGQHDGIHFITMGYIEGRPLTDYIKSGKEQGEKSIALLIRKLALALHEAHQKGIIHRDLKPANVMINQRNEPIVMDFGLARQISEDREVRMTREGIALGSPGYMSPEQVQGRTDLGPATDIYSLGVVLYELLTGEPPFTGNVLSVLHQITQTEPKPPQELRPTLSPGMAAICQKAMAKKPEERYRSMRELAEAVTSFVKSEGTTATEVPLMVANAILEPPATAEYSAVKQPLPKTRKLPAQTAIVAARPQREPEPEPALPRPRKKKGKRKQDAAHNFKLLIGGAAVVVLAVGAGLMALLGGGDDAASSNNVAAVSPPSQQAVVVDPAPAASHVQPQPVANPAPVVTPPVQEPAVPVNAAPGPGVNANPAVAQPQPGPGPNVQQPQFPGPGGGGPGMPEGGGGFQRGPAAGFDPNFGPGRGGFGPPPVPNSDDVFVKYDADKNGQLDPTEAPLHIILRADTNGDQMMSEEELKVAKAKLADRLFAEPTEQENQQRAGMGPGERGPGERGRRGPLRRGAGQRNPPQPPRGG